MENFIKSMLQGKKSKKSVVDQLYVRPKKDINGNQATMPILELNYAQFIDLLYLPNDYGMKYCLTLADQGSRYVAGVPLEDRKVKDIVKGLKTIYKNNKK